MFLNNVFYHWRNKYGGMQTPEVQRLKDLERENRRQTGPGHPHVQGCELKQMVSLAERRSIHGAVSKSRLEQ